MLGFLENPASHAVNSQIARYFLLKVNVQFLLGFFGLLKSCFRSLLCCSGIPDRVAILVRLVPCFETYRRICKTTIFHEWNLHRFPIHRFLLHKIIPSGSSTAIMHQSIPPARSPRPRLLRGICPPCQSRGYLQLFALPGGWAFANPGAIPELLTRTRFPIRI